VTAHSRNTAALAAFTMVAAVGCSSSSHGLAAAPVGVPMTSIGRACGLHPDTVPPVVTGVTLSSRSINLSHGAQQLVVTIDAKDQSADGPPSGVKEVQVEFSGPGALPDAHLALASGTPGNGIWRAIVPIPVMTRPGRWRIINVEVVDNDGNGNTYSHGYGPGYSGPTDIVLRGWGDFFTVAGSAPAPPAPKAPTFVGLIASRRSIDIRSRIQAVHVTARWAGAPAYHVTVAASTPGRTPHHPLRARLRKSADGRWRGVLVFRPGMRPGEWQLGVTAEFGPHSNPQATSGSGSPAAGQPAPTTIDVDSVRDPTPPVVSSVSVRPFGATANPGDRLTVIAHVADPQSGVRNIGIEFRAAGGGEGSELGAKLTRRGDHWIGHFRVRRCSANGHWRLYNVDAHNRAFGHLNLFGKRELRRSGLAASFTVAGGEFDDPVPTVVSATRNGDQLTLDFSEGVRNVSSASLTVYRHAASGFEFGRGPLTITAISCRRNGAPVDCTGRSGLVTSTTLTVPGAPPPIPKLPATFSFGVLANQGVVVGQLSDELGRPMTWTDQVWPPD
jgi:hypothetical protein